MASTVVLKASGLQTSPNELSREEGALVEANNIIIKRDGIIEQRRGFKVYGDNLPDSTFTVKQLTLYRNRLIRHFEDTLQYDSDGSGSFAAFVGSFMETEVGLRMKFIESNGNFYFTTSDGIKKITARSASDFSNTDAITSAGAIKSVDFETDIIYTPNSQSAFLPQDSAVAYRTVWGYKDLNNNLVLGAPSQRVVASNPMTELLIRDYMRVLTALDSLSNSPSTTARINDYNYIDSLGLTLNNNATDLYTNLISLTTKIDTDILIGTQLAGPLQISSAAVASNIVTVTIIGTATDYLEPGSLVYLGGGWDRGGTQVGGAVTVVSVGATTFTYNFTAANGAVTLASATINSNEYRSITPPISPDLPATNDQLLELQGYIEDILDRFQEEPDTIISASDKTDLNNLDITTTSTVQVTVTIPEGIDSRYFLQLYRSSIAQAVEAATFEDIFPSDEMQLVYEAYPTPAELAAMTMTFTDITPDDFRGANLYTNEATGEGILQANDIPPFAKDINRYRNSTFYANTRTQHRLLLSLLGVTEMITDYDNSITPQITISNGDVSTTYDFVVGQQEITEIITVADVTNSLNSKYFLIDSVTTPYYVYFETTTAIDPAVAGRTGIKVKIDTNSSATTVATKLKSILSTYLDDFITSVSSSTPVTITGTNASPGVFTLASHNLKLNEPIIFTTTGSFSGLTSGNTYYVRNPGANTFELSLTSGGASINTTGAQAGIHSISQNKVVEVTCFETGITEDAVDIDTTFGISNTQQGISERVQPEITKFTTVAGSLLTAAGTADYITLNAPFDQEKYYFWFDNGITTDPAVAGRTGIPVEFDGTETADDIADLIEAIIPDEYFTVSVSTNEVTITAIQYGYCDNATEVVANAGFLVSIEQEGALEVELSPLVSPARSVDETARSFIRVINKNPGESIYAYYLSSATDVPGKMLLESRSLTDTEPFYILGNNDNTGLSFNPNIGPDGQITVIAAGDPAVITTSSSHGMIDGDQVMITGTDSVPRIDGLHTISFISSTQFSINREIITPGTAGSFIPATNGVYSENEEKINRVYYSKFLQPDAVPITNFFDVGAADQEILRIFPLRDSLFVFKKDGLYRISGESAPFTLELFDNSFIILAPDSIAVSNNILYGWTTQGVQSLTEGGATIISRPIDNIFLNIQSSNYPNFKTSTWGVGYESDNSYLVFTVSNQEDEFATIAYRYSTLTNTWTTYDKSCISGIVNNFDDKLYLSPSDIPNIEQERKTFTRLDQADREYNTLIANGKLLNSNIVLPSVSDFSIGDVFVQDQTLTVFEFNQLLDKLDYDPGPADEDYLADLELSRGENARARLFELAQKLDADTNVNTTTYADSIDNKLGTISTNNKATATIITTPSPHELITGRIITIDSSNSVPSINGTYAVTVINSTQFSIPVRVTTTGSAGNWQTQTGDFRDLKVCYNEIIRLLNLDSGLAFSNYKILTNNTLQEAIITSINTITKTITLNLELDYIVGNAIVYKAIDSSFTYSPTTMGDPLNYKHLREATVMFETRNITSGSLSFSTDLLPEFQTVNFELEGNGIFGHVNPFGGGFFGGIASGAPFRTYIPRQCMRCRYIVLRFQHSTARENYKITGMTLTGEVGQSTRAYR